MALSPGDPNSFSRPDQVVVTHVHLELTVDFTKHILSGKVILDVQKKGAANILILDNSKLVIHKVLNASDSSTLNYTIGESGTFGAQFRINLPDNTENSYKVEIQYETSPGAMALQWLTPEQTAGGQHPYMFSQCQSIFARSMLPCQDTPSAKLTYSAKIFAPQELTVLMSALRGSISDTENGMKVYEFNQPVPIPTYLIAIAAGALVSEPLGPRCNVWAEKEFIDRCAYEFAETETMLRVAEHICGPYVWGIYDLLVLPPSFAYGGMENPCLTFVTPTLLVGDRSLANVVAHEISHSWTGNLVTNANFEHFWLNEGFTNFVERKINGRMFSEKVRHFEALEGLNDLRDAIKTLGETSPMTNLVTDLTNIDPDDTYSSVPYEKGHTFLFYLEQLLGGAEVFDPFLRSYINEFKYKSIVTSDWKKYLYDFFQDKTEVLNSVDWEAWLHTPGMPPVIPDYDKTLINACIELAKRWLNWDENTLSPFATSDITNLTSMQKKAFLSELLLSDMVLPLKKVEKIQEIYDFDSMKNSDIRVTWLRLCIKSRWADKVTDALTFATDVGRLKFVRPIFKDLYNWSEMRQRAIDKYNEKKSKMMYVTAHALAKDLHLE